MKTDHSEINVRDGKRPGDMWSSSDLVELSKDGVVIDTFCGFHACNGKCGLPAAYIVWEDHRWFLRGSMTAVGPIMQRVCQHTDGTVVDLAELLDPDELNLLMGGTWW